MLVGAKGDVFHTNTVYTRFVSISSGGENRAASKRGQDIAYAIKIALQAILCQTDYCGGVLYGGQSASGEISCAAAFSRELLKDFFQQRVHVLSGFGMLRENHVSGLLVGEQGDYIFGFCQG